MRGAPWSDIADDMARGRADGTHKLIAPLPSVTLRYRDGRPDLESGVRKNLI